MSQFYQTPVINIVIFNNRVKLRLNITIINIEKKVNWFTLGLLLNDQQIDSTYRKLH